jgi:hypothetical protein
MIYTSIAEYAGGTYVGRYQVGDSRAAAIAHLKDLEAHGLVGQEVIEAISQKDAAQLTGLRGAWRITSRGMGELVLINIVATRDE